MLTIIIGKSASGKNFIMNQHLLLGAKPVITYTTRPIRKGEKNGKDYHFVSVQKFMNLRKKHKFAECRSYRTLVDNKPEYWWYGSPLINVENNDYVRTILPRTKAGKLIIHSQHFPRMKKLMPSI